MIEIVNIEKHGFPTIDFKFQNTGHTTAFLWQFTIEVLEAEIDPTPVLEFSFRAVRESSTNPIADDNSLVIEGVNNGWGLAKNCDIVIEEPTLNYFFTEQQRTFKGVITDGESKEIILLTATDIDAGEFKKFHTKRMEAAWKEIEQDLPKYLEWNRGFRSTDELERDFEAYKKRERARFINQWLWSDPWVSRPVRVASYDDSSALRIPIESPQVKWKCHDSLGNVKKGEDTVRPGFDEVVLTTTGFQSVYVDRPAFCIRHSDTTYCTVLDPSLGPHTRDYGISREIRAGDAERFHILVGASKSSKIRLRFIFFIDKDKKLASEEFKIEVWNPRNSRLNYDYKDGEYLERVGRQYREEDYSIKWQLEEYRRERSKKNYPFLDLDRDSEASDTM